MKLMISAGPVSPAKLVVVDGHKIIEEYEVGQSKIIPTIDKIFNEKYIEAVQFMERNAYTEKFEKHILDSYQSVEVL